MNGRTVDICCCTIYKKKRLKQIWQNLATACSSLGGRKVDVPYFSIIFYISPKKKEKKKVSVNSDTQSRNRNQQSLKS